MLTVHRSVLREKVEQRRLELADALDAAATEGDLVGNADGIKNELAVVRELTSGGWELMTENIASQLSRWLDLTQYLVKQNQSSLNIVSH
jgi:hypothetical protein